MEADGLLTVDVNLIMILIGGCREVIKKCSFSTLHSRIKAYFIFFFTSPL